MPHRPMLSRGEGSAVWKYMPKVVNADVSTWLKNGILSGHAENVSLKLKGDEAIGAQIVIRAIEDLPENNRLLEEERASGTIEFG